MDLGRAAAERSVLVGQTSRLVHLLRWRLLGLQIVGHELQNIDDMILERQPRHSVARRGLGPGKFGPFVDDGRLVSSDEIRQPQMRRGLVAGHVAPKALFNQKAEFAVFQPSLLLQQILVSR